MWSGRPRGRRPAGPRGRARASAARRAAPGSGARRRATRAAARALRRGRTRARRRTSSSRASRWSSSRQRMSSRNGSYANSSSGRPRQRSSASRRSRARSAGSGRPPPAELLEPAQVERAAVSTLEDIAGRLRPSRSGPSARRSATIEFWSEVAAVFGALSPQIDVDQRLGRDDLAPAQQKQREDGALARPAEGDRRAVIAVDLERAEDSKGWHVPVVTRLAATTATRR